MPRDSSGNYTLPLGNPVIDGTVIDTNWANPTMSDIAVQLNNVLTRDGLLGPTAAFYAVDGTPALPGLAFASQHGTGLWKDSTQVGISYQGVAKQVWNATGTQITGNLDVTGNINVTGTGPYVLKTGDTMTGALSVLPAEQLIARFRSTDPSSGYTTFGAASTDRGYIGSGPSVIGAMAVADFGIASAGGALWFGVPGPAPMIFAINASERMRIDAAGNVGIGIVPVNTKLHVAGNALLQTAAAGELNYSLTSGGSAFVGFGLNLTGATNGFGAPANSAYLGNTAAIPLVFTTGGVERIRIDPTGQFVWQMGGIPKFILDSSANVFIGNTLAVPVTPGSGGYLLVEAGALKYRGSSGTLTVIAPA